MYVIDEFYSDFEKCLEYVEKEMCEVEIKDEFVGEDCEECGLFMVYKMGCYGKFMVCFNFFDCCNIKLIVKEIGVKCLKCEEGNIVEWKLKKKCIFYGCDWFLGCDFVFWDKLIVRKCLKCENLFVEKK